MKRLGIVLSILTAVTIFSCGTALVYGASVRPIEPPTVAFAPNANAIFNLVNIERAKVGVKPLVRDARLDAVAQGRANDMSTRNYYGHRDPITDENMVKHQPYCKYASENLDGAVTSREAVSEWLGSPSHKQAMLSPDNSISGIGIAVQGGYYVIVQTFCVL